MNFRVTPLQLSEIIQKATSITMAKVSIGVFGDRLVVSIKKVGTSVISFLITQPPGSEYEDLTLVSEDISWFHKGYVDTMKKAIADLVTSCGGTVIGK